MDSDWITSYSEKSGSDLYYIKIVDLGNITVDSFVAAIRSIHDDQSDTESEFNYSDSTNQLFTASSTNINITPDSVWKNIPEDKFISLSSIYIGGASKDYVEIYPSNANNVAIFNSSLICGSGQI